MDVAQPASGRALMATSGALLGSAIFFGGGSGDGSVWWIGVGVVLVAGTALVLAALGRLDVPRLGASEAVLLAALGGLVAWAGLSVLWSVTPDRSWDGFDKGLVLLGFLGLGLLAARGPQACRLAAGVVAALLGAALVWALLGKAIPALFPDGGRVARLRNPVGYWNGLALLADFAVPLGLWLGTRTAAARWVRAAGALLVYAAVLVVLLAASRTGLLAGLASAGLWLLLADRRVEGALLGLAAALPALAVGGWAFTRSALVDDGQAHADRVRDGAAFGVLVLLGALVVAGIVWWAVGRELRRRDQIGRGLVAGAAAVVAVALVALVVAVGNPVTWAADQFSTSAATANTPGRLLDPSSNNRWQWWNEAWDVWRANELAGAGAGSFEVARKRFRAVADEVRQPHSVPLQELSDGGVIGLALFLAAVAAAAWVCVAALRRLGGEERAAAVGLVVLPAAWLLHGLADYDLDFLATTAPPLFALGVLGASGRTARRARRAPWALAVVAAGLAVVAVLVSPALAERGVSTSLADLERGDFDRALEAARRARSLDPFALEPIRAVAFVYEAAGNRRAALRAYRDGVQLQPDNPRAWELLGSYQYSLGDLCAAYVSLNEAYTRDPNGAQWRKGGELDRARAYVNAGRCG